jgi:CheY-like chemotaxis protein
MRLYLPRSRDGAEPAPATARPAARATPAAKEAILLVDDNSALRRATVRRLAALGYRVCDAENGHGALAILQSGESVDLLFTDIGLPGGMDGRQLAVAARQQRPGLKVLFTSG